VEPPALDGPRDTTPSTYRDAGASAIGTIHAKTGDWATTKVNKKFKNWLKYDAPPGFNTGADRNCFRQHKKLVKAAERLASGGAFQALGIANTLSDSGARVGGHLMEGDVGGAGVALLDEGAKGLSATGAAWAGGTYGAKVGLAIGGPPGSMVGGAVGAVAGAVVATVGYNAFVSPTLTEAVEGAMEPDYVELARRNRAEHLAAEALREKEKEQAIEQARQNRREFLAEVERLRTEPPHQLRAAPDADPPPPDASRPVIPADCTIVTTIWNTEHPEHTAEIVYHVRNNEVTATCIMPRPTYDHVANWQSRFQFDGKLTENRIGGTGRWHISYDSISSNKDYMWHIQSQSTSTDDVVFNADGTLHATHNSSHKTTFTVRQKPANSKAEDRSNTSRHTATVAGRWKFGGGAKDKAN
ncbi:MAG: hypothetical protein U1E05_02165, partial [Patescibacteria group bacterium]|nr:hypothetical protein [Patescibacteria group bacterium]